jgi:CIC family chloride channel protein
MKIKQSWRRPLSWPIFRLDERLLLMLIAIIVGLSSGLAALALNFALLSLFEWLHHYRHYWWAFLLPGIGAALSSLFLEKIVKEGAGHGVPEVIYSVSRYGGLLRLRSSFSRLISSCLTIGSGGSAGPEAPVVMSGASIGANIANLFSLNDRQRITLVGCGAAGAISAIFNAPIAGLVFAVEVILGEWSALTIVPIALAAVAGAELTRIIRGNQILFTTTQFSIDLADISACIGLAVLTAAISIIFTRTMRWSHHLSGQLTIPQWTKAGLGGCGVGVIALFLPVVMGEGYHSIQDMIEGVFAPGLFFVFVALVAKIGATALTLGWGGSGGIFAPCLVIGSLAGLTFHRGLLMLWPSVEWIQEGCFALLGMAGLIGGILQAPLTAIFLIVEITGGYGVILPLILVAVISTTLCHIIEPASFYLKELKERGHLLRPGTDARVLTDLSVFELLEKDCICVPQTMTLREFIEIVKQSKRNYFPVEEAQSGRYLGIIHLDDVRPYLFDTAIYDAVLVEQLMHAEIGVIHPEDDLQEVLNQMDANRLYSMPVVSNHRFLGMLSKATLLDQYRKELRVQTSG